MHSRPVRDSILTLGAHADVVLVFWCSSTLCFSHSTPPNSERWGRTATCLESHRMDCMNQDLVVWVLPATVSQWCSVGVSAHKRCTVPSSGLALWWEMDGPEDRDTPGEAAQEHRLREREAAVRGVCLTHTHTLTQRDKLYSQWLIRTILDCWAVGWDSVRHWWIQILSIHWMNQERLGGFYIFAVLMVGLPLSCKVKMHRQVDVSSPCCWAHWRNWN